MLLLLLLWRGLRRHIIRRLLEKGWLLTELYGSVVSHYLQI